MGRALRIAIVGGGAAGATLGALLAERGADVAIFHDGRRPPLVVGESLVPAIVPILRRLGIEDEVAALGVHKPGVTFAWGPDDVYRFLFERFADRFPPYAYNVPRPAFDDLVLARARKAGARVVGRRVVLAPTDGGAVAIDAASRSAAGWDDAAPDFIADASGRTRAIARTLGLAERRGPRDDVAHFAHYTDFDWDETPGTVLISRLTSGWSWRIPLRSALSVGVVIPRDVAVRLGASPEERLERAITEEPTLAAAGRRRERVTDVVTYSNYQLVTEHGHGPGWALVGDAFGFVDPMLSPGVFLALRSAELLADTLAPAVHHMPVAGEMGDVGSRLVGYQAAMHLLFEAWLELIETLYSGTLFGLYRAGTDLVRDHDNLFTRLMERHIGLHIAGMAAGVRTTSPYSRGLIRTLSKYGMRGVDPRELAVR